MTSSPLGTPPDGLTASPPATRPSALGPPGGGCIGSNEANRSRRDKAYRKGSDGGSGGSTSPYNHTNGTHCRSTEEVKGVAGNGGERVGGLSPSERLGAMTPIRRSSMAGDDADQSHPPLQPPVPTRAESKRHSWAARQQHAVIPEETAPALGNVGINRALSLDSAITGRTRLAPAPARTPTDMQNGSAWSGTLESTQQLQHFNAVSSNGSLRKSTGDVAALPVRPPRPLSPTQDFMDISHDPTTQSDQTKYITHSDADRVGHSGCCGSSCSTCCTPGRSLHNFCTNLFRHGSCSCKEKSDDSELDEDIYIEDDPFRKRCLGAFLNFVYVMLAFIAVIVTYSMIQDLITAMNNPVRSIHYKKLKDYEAPGISMYPGGAKFLACGHYYNNVVTSKVRTSDLDLVNRNCTYTRLNYDDPHYIGVRRDVLVVRGPTSFEKREAIFLHFELEDETRDFFTVSYFVFPGWDNFNASTVPGQIDKLTEYHRYMPTFALSSGLRMWIKLIMSETYLMDDTKHTEFRVEKEEAKHTEFNVEYSVVKFWDRRPEKFRKKHLFFIFFEWKNNIVEQSYLIYTTTPWSIGAGLCGVFLTLHRGYQLAQIGYKRARKDKERRSIRKRTIRELRKAKSMERREGSAVVNRKLRQQLSS